ncbi:hypothetical protein [uncultured Chryseobacterium sp.]|nr:hypothetical protein [uncultured Chryseobacterium sp.]
MKLNKFSMQKMSVAEMSAIKAGSGCSGNGWTTDTTGGDLVNSAGDTDRD